MKTKKSAISWYQKSKILAPKHKNKENRTNFNLKDQNKE
jgi:hypothetical protein